MIDYLIGALIGCAATGLVAGLLAEYAIRHAPQPEPQRVTPEDLRPLSDALASLSRTLRATHSRGADEVTAAAHLAVNLERQARGLPPLAGPRLTDADVGPLLRRTYPTDVSRETN